MPADFDFDSMHAAIAAYHNTVDKHRRWKEARPFLHAGQCAYMKSLILEMISAVEAIIGFQRAALELRRMDADDFETKHRYWHEELKVLYQLLHDDPPPLGPASAAPERAALFHH